jgi:2OG-Fe(II) oxygenase superfamily
LWYNLLYLRRTVRSFTFNAAKGIRRHYGNRQVERRTLYIEDQEMASRIFYSVKPLGPLLLVLTLMTSSAFGFFAVVRTRRPIHTAETARLFAKKKAGSSKKQNPANAASRSSSSGFGASAPPVVMAVDGNDDCAIFPALEPNVVDTLIPSSSAAMTNEIYQRLDQIYGFPHFNYERVSIGSMADMLLSTATTSYESSTIGGLDEFLRASSALNGIDLDSLLAAAAGGSASTLLRNSDSAPPIRSKEKNEHAGDTDVSSYLNRLPAFDSIRVLHVDPLVLAIDNFFTHAECDRYIQKSDPKKSSGVVQSRSPTVGKDAAAKAQRTSTTFYHTFQSVPELMSKAARLLGVDTIERFEEPQTVRYRRNERFTWHLDALGPIEMQGRTSSGQRTATLLVYLTDLPSSDGGATLFRDLGSGSEQYLRVQPTKGTALLFFPSAGGIPSTPFDIRTLHSGEAVSVSAEQDKWIAQLWLRQRDYAPTAPPGNRHLDATDAIAAYCEGQRTIKNGRRKKVD